MPKSVLTYKLFLASPGDVIKERKEVEKVVKVYNNLNSANNIKIDLVNWENSSFPSFGKYPQDVVNNQIGEDYDIFVGLLWTRFGTPTPNYESGTEEEFCRAYDRFRKGDNIGLMIYCKDDSISPSSIDLEQLQKVKKFISRIGDLGGYYFTFDTSDNFHDLFLNHLTKMVNDLIAKNGVEIGTDVGISNDLNDDTGNWGFIEYIDCIIQLCTEVNANIDTISELTLEIGNQMEHYTQKIYTMQKQPNVFQIKNLLANVAKDMNRYAKDIEIPNVEWHSNYLELQKAIKGLLAVSQGLISVEKWENLIATMRYTSSQMGDSYSSMRQFYSSVNSLPKMSQQLNVARNNVCNKLKSVISNLKEGQLYCNQTIEHIEDTIHPMEV